MSLYLSKKTILLLAQAWRGTLRDLRNFAILNEIDWDQVDYERDRTSSSVESYAEAVVSIVLEQDKLTAYLDEIGHGQVSALLDNINNDLEEQNYNLWDMDDGWAFIKLIKKENTKKKESKSDIEEKPQNETGTNSDIKQWDVFISHATEDKQIATPLVGKLKEFDLNVWYDKDVLRWGDSLMESINNGLKKSIFGIVIFSKTFFKKRWTMTELKALVALANATGEKKILPLLYEISHKELTDQYPILSDIVARSWDEGLENLASEVKELIDEKKRG